MKRSVWQWIAASSLLLASLAVAETRPQYGGTLRVALHDTPATLEPADSTAPDSFARRNLTLLIFETLVTLDDGGHVHPALASSWQGSPDNRRWQFRIRQGVKFHDGSALTSESVAASLRAANSSWNVTANGDSVVIELNQSDSGLPAALALPRNAIAKKTFDGKIAGTGPFHITDWLPGKKLSLAAEEDYWRGRPFLDAIEIEMSRNFHDQLVSLELGRSDLIEVAIEQSHRISMDGRGVASSFPMEFGALLFAREVQSDDDKLLRSALSLCIDRVSIRNVLLQGAGQPAGGILPNWMSGYEFVFPSDPDLAAARRQIGQLRGVPALTIGYDPNDSLARLIVERIVLNAKDAGLKLQPVTGANADLRFIRLPLASSDPWLSLTEVAQVIRAPLPNTAGKTVEDIYAAEQTLRASQRLIPLFHAPINYAIAPNVRNWSLTQSGSWNLADIWLANNQR